jgi:hypothetical protein
MFPEGGQTRKHCFVYIAMFPKGGQTRKHCFLAMFPEGEQPTSGDPQSTQKQVQALQYLTQRILGIKLLTLMPLLYLLQFSFARHPLRDSKTKLKLCLYQIPN